MNRNFLLFLLCIPAMGIAQESLTLQDAIALGLKNNYNILLAKNDSMLHANDATPGAAGMLPTVGFTSAATQSSSTINQKFSTGLELKRSGVSAGNLNAGIALNWTLFDGFKMFATLDKLKEIKSQGELQVRQEMETTVSNIISAYFSISKLKQQFNSIREQVNYFEERVKIAESRLEAGNGNKTDVLQAKVDLNEQKSALLKQKTLISNAKIALNELLGREASIDFTPTDTAVLDATLNLDKSAKNLEQGNSSLLLANSNIKTSGFMLKEFQAQRYPKISLITNYNFARNTSTAGFALFNQNAGLTYGLNFSWTLFNGFNAKTSIEDAKLAQFAAQLQYDLAKQKQLTLLTQAHNKLQEALELYKLEDESVKMATENVSIMLERFRLGQSTTLELKDAQNSLLNAKTRYINALYDAKMAETEMKRLDGSLL